jgi:hypothetical protein
LLGVESFLLELRVQRLRDESFSLNAQLGKVPVEQKTLELEQKRLIGDRILLKGETKSLANERMELGLE